jgi:hypothetical protein
MRLWSLHPCQLDRQGLLAVWREGLLAQKVLAGGTKGYRNHPQLRRFRARPEPLAALGAYLVVITEEAAARGYRFDGAKILRPGPVPPMPVTTGQIDYELQHLGRKLRLRDPERYAAQAQLPPRLHPLFIPVPGAVEEWEVIP